MSFSSDLLDGFDLLNKRTEGVLKSSTNLASFLKDLAKVEKDYAKSLAKVAKDQRVSFQKAPAQQKEVGSTFSAWDSILGEIEKIAEHHSQYSDKLQNDLSTNILNYVKEGEKNRRKLQTDATKLTKDYKDAVENLKKVRSKYVTLSKEADQTESIHTKGKGDMNMKPKDLAKLAARASQAADKASQSDSEYQQTLSSTNQKQNEFYQQTMPSLLREFQKFEEERLRFQKEITQKFASLNNESPQFYNNTCSTINNNAESIDIDNDIKLFVNENKTGVNPPAEIQYTKYDVEAPSPTPPLGKSPSRPALAKQQSKYVPGGTQTNLLAKEWGLSHSDHNLSQDQQRAKLQGQLEELDKAINIETKTKDGLENLIKFYGKDPVQQKKAEDELNDSEQKLQKLIEAKNTVQSQLAQLTGGEGGQLRVRGIYDYQATCDTELSFKEGDIMLVTERDDSGWWYATLGDKTGFVPNNYVNIMQ